MPRIRLAARLLLALLPVALGVALVLRAVLQREPVPERPPEEVVTAVRVLPLRPMPFAPRIVTHGTVEPAAVWRAVARVPGEVVRMHPDLRPGRLLEAGTEILRLDATDHELAEARALASLSAAEARLLELELREANLQGSLAIEQRAMALAEADLDRRRALLRREAASQAAVDGAEAELLQRRQRVQEIENRLRLLPAERRVQEAERSMAGVRLAEARRAIARTRLHMPFDGRIAEVAVEVEQFVTAGQPLLVVQGTSEAEVSARLRLDQLAALIAGGTALPEPGGLSLAEIEALPIAPGIAAELRVELAGRTLAWPAAVRRLDFALDPRTRTVGLVLGVADPLRQAIPGERPPLVPGMFVEVVLTGPSREGALVVPREALRRGPDGGWTAFVADAEDRLRRRRVVLGALHGLSLIHI